MINSQIGKNRSGLGKKSRKIALTSAVLIASASFSMNASAADVLAYWDFGSVTSGTLLTADSGALSVTQANAANASDVIAFNGVTSNVSLFGGTTINNITLTSTGKSDTAGSALAPQSTNNNGATLIFTINTIGYNAPILSYASQGTGTGFKDQNWAYSIDNGATFTSFTDITSIPGSFALETIDFSTISGLSNITNAMFRLTLTGATTTTLANGTIADSGNNRFDNLQFDANSLTSGITTLTWAPVGTSTAWDTTSANWKQGAHHGAVVRKSG